MIEAQNSKFVLITAPAAIIDNAAATTTAFDIKDWDYIQVFVLFGAMDIAATVCKMQESEDSGMSGAADITGLVYGTSTNVAGSTSTLPSATSDNTLFLFEYESKGRMRYQDLGLTLGDGSAGTYVCAWAILSRGHTTPVTTAQRGAAQILRL